MKKKSEMEDELRPEYDFSKLTVVARGRGRKIPAGTAITLDPDVAEMFPTSESVNEALRLLARAAKESDLQLNK
ncbi:MAG: hypothetical protein ACR2MD_18935 [Aridibacter sp.]|jgi:hypothetical protein